MPVPEGSSIVFAKCEPHQFINLDGPENPATLLAVFGPSLQSGDSVDVSDNPGCLQQGGDGGDYDTSAATTVPSTGMRVASIAAALAAAAFL